MRLVFIILAIAILASAAPPEKEKKGKAANDAPKTSNKVAPPERKKPLEKESKNNSSESNNATEANANSNASSNANENEQEQAVDRDYCYDSSWSFKCRQVNPAEHDLECRIANVDGDPCFPDLVKMIEASAPLSSISYPVHSLEAEDAARKIEVTQTMITADNIESISLHAPFECIPADAFANMPVLKRITLESVDGVKLVKIDRHAFRNTTAKHLHLAGHDIRHILAQKVDLHNFHTITFTDMELDCTQNTAQNNQNQIANVSCERTFEDLKSVENLYLETIYVDGEEMDERVFHPMWDTLKKLNVDVVFKRQNNQQIDNMQANMDKNNTHESNSSSGNNTPIIKHHGHFPVETFAFMTRLEDMELYLYEPIVGLSIDNGTAIPLPVSKTLTRLVLSCRYCKEVNMQDLGKWLPNLHHLTIAAPLEASILTERALKSFSKLEELVIYDGDMKGIKSGAFKSTPALKHLSIKYASISELKHEHLEGLEDTLESLSIVGTPIKHINVSQMNHLSSLDVSQNHLTTIERNMLPEKAQFSELNISYNPIKHIENGFLSGVEMKNHIIHMRGLDIETFDMNAWEGIEKLQTVDITQNLKLKKLQVTDYKKLPTDLHRIVVGRSPYLKLDDEQGHISKMLIERNITMVVEGKVACCCKMQWMAEMEKEHPDLIEIDRSRAMCSREGTKVDNNMPDWFWKNPTVVNFMKVMKDEKVALCKKTEEKKEEKKN